MPFSIASSTTLIVSIWPATACAGPDRDLPQRIDHRPDTRQKPAVSRTPQPGDIMLEQRARSSRNSERHNLGMTERHQRNPHLLGLIANCLFEFLLSEPFMV